MVWDAMQVGLEKYSKFPKWPKPFGQVQSIDEIICNDDMWLAEIVTIGESAMEWFWSNLIPQPTEIIRKVFTGSYKCGFYLNIKVKSPVEILWGKGSNRFIAMIIRPFATAAFALWATNIALDALHAWSTMMSIFGRCEETKGSFLVENKSAPLGSGNPAGAIPGGTVRYDKYGQVVPGITAISYGPGLVSLKSFFIVEAGSHTIEKVEIGHLVEGIPQGIVDLGGLGPGGRVLGAASFDEVVSEAGAANSWIRLTNSSGPGLSDVLVTVFTGDVPELS